MSDKTSKSLNKDLQSEIDILRKTRITRLRKEGKKITEDDKLGMSYLLSALIRLNYD